MANKDDCTPYINVGSLLCKKKRKEKKKRTVEKEPNMGNEKIKAQQWREREREEKTFMHLEMESFVSWHTHIRTKNVSNGYDQANTQYRRFVVVFIPYVHRALGCFLIPKCLRMDSPFIKKRKTNGKKLRTFPSQNIKLVYHYKYKRMTISKNVKKRI